MQERLGDVPRTARAARGVPRGARGRRRGPLLLTLVEAWQVFARYVLESPPGWTEPVALLFLKFALMLGAAVGVREETHFRFLLWLQATRPVPAAKALEAAARLTAAALRLALAGYGARA